jgi:hypothetical protein
MMVIMGDGATAKPIERHRSRPAAPPSVAHWNHAPPRRTGRLCAGANGTFPAVWCSLIITSSSLIQVVCAE